MLEVKTFVSKQELYRIVKNELDYISDNYHDDVLDMAGWNNSELIDALMGNTRFLDQVSNCVRQYGQEFLDMPWDFNSGISLPEFMQLDQHLANIRTIMIDAEHESELETEFAKAVKLVQSRGYSVV